MAFWEAWGVAHLWLVVVLVIFLAAAVLAADG